jgi:hypothetical protein
MICRFVSSIGGSTTFDLNDKVNYFYLEGSEFPLPEVKYDWVENALNDGARLASWTLGDNKLTLNLLIKGTTAAETYQKLQNFLRQVLKEGYLEIRLWNALNSVYYKTRPALPKLPDITKKYVIDQHCVSNIKIEIPVFPRCWTSQVSYDLGSVTGADSIIVAPGEIEGDLPTSCDIYISNSTSTGVWPAQDSGIATDLCAVSAFDSTHAWAVGYNNKIIYWNGATWSAQTSPLVAYSVFKGIVAASTTTAYALDQTIGIILKTTNAGATWTPTATTPPLSAGPNGIDAASVNEVFICGSNSDVYKTANGGTTWTAVDIPAINMQLMGISVMVLIKCGWWESMV